MLQVRRPGRARRGISVGGSDLTLEMTSPVHVRNINVEQLF